jgi:hypothetical protein
MGTVKLFSKITAGLFVVACSLNAQALLLGPGDAHLTSNTNSALDAGDVASLFGTSDLTRLYKMNFDAGEEGSHENAYSTTFSGDPNDALITWDGPAIIQCPECYLVVKDGNEPQYLFDLTSFFWNGMEDLDLKGFYLDQGAISHVAIYGKSVSVQVPEPGTLGLLGLGILGMMTVRRKVNLSA